MTRDELIALTKITEAENEKNKTFDIQKCLEEKRKIEDEYAEFTLCKRTGPFTRWFLQKKDGTEVELEFFDRLECIHIEKSFDIRNNYKGTIFASLVELSPDCIKLRVDDKTGYLISEGCKVFSIHKSYVPQIEQTETIGSSLRMLGRAFMNIFRK